MEDKDLHWLAGLLEGEGSFCKGPPSNPNSALISIQMVDEDIISRVSNLFGVSYFFIKSKNERWKDTYSTIVRGKSAVNLMIQLRPLMGLRRQGQIDAALSHYSPERKTFLKVDIENIKKMQSSGMLHREIAEIFDVRREVITRLLNRNK